MKLKTLKKKIGRLETRLLEGPKKLAKLKGKLAALVKANASPPDGSTSHDFRIGQVPQSP